MAKRESVLRKVSLDGRHLEHAAAEFRNDRAIVLAAVSNAGLALRFASAELLSDREVVLTAIAQDTRAVREATEELGLLLARDPTVLQEYFSEQYVFVISTLSGRSFPCWAMEGYCGKGWLLCYSLQKLGFPITCVHGAELYWEGVPVPSSQPCRHWTGLLQGHATNLQLVFSMEWHL
mmetsp:Transcript_52004/g.96258  ORF Transcript_52004/g.96258 Transcript_52004/m.96258 type:complete len:178 (-) Transcript_52004:388-921(-)